MGEPNIKSITLNIIEMYGVLGVVDSIIDLRLNEEGIKRVSIELDFELGKGYRTKVLTLTGTLFEGE
jgi:hypothetical protein